MKSVEHSGEKKGGNHGRHCNFDVTAVRRHFFHLFFQRIDGLQNIFDLLAEKLPFNGKTQAVVLAVKQFDAEFFFQFLYAKGYRGLTNKKFVRRLGDTAVTAHSVKIFELQQFHGDLTKYK